jgi:pentatricopeptide repeat protein
MWQCGGELVPDIVSYNTVMKACGNAQQTDTAFQVWIVMLRPVDEFTSVSLACGGTLVARLCLHYRQATLTDLLVFVW